MKDTNPAPAVERLLGPGDGVSPFRRRTLVWAVVALAAIAALVVAGLRLGHRPAAGFVTEPVRRGDLVAAVSATGAIDPTNQVDVGSELSGTVERVLVDENDRVRKGQVLAQLDLTKFQDQIAQTRAAAAAAQARVLQADATRTEARLNLERLRRLAEISAGKLPSRQELEAGEATLARAVADAAAARAALVQAQASLRADQTNLVKATIHSPIDGVVLARKIEPGQTVAASFQAPVLFTLAEDLAKMQLKVDIDEADVGQVREGQPAEFSVDAWPTRRFHARVLRVNLGSQTKDGVVSYVGVLDVANPDLSLRPGMTATAQITAAERRGVLLAPNAALRFAPAPAQTRAPSRGLMGSLMPRMPRVTGRRGGSGANGGPRLWVVKDGRAVSIPVTVGATNGQWSEVSGPGLRAGLAVITDGGTAKP